MPLFPVSNHFVGVDTGGNNVAFLPKSSIRLLVFNRPTQEASLFIGSTTADPYTFPDTEENINYVLQHRDTAQPLAPPASGRTPAKKP